MYEGKFRTRTADRMIHDYYQNNSSNDTTTNIYSEVNINISMPSIRITINLPSEDNDDCRCLRNPFIPARY